MIYVNDVTKATMPRREKVSALELVKHRAQTIHLGQATFGGQQSISQRTECEPQSTNMPAGVSLAAVAKIVDTEEVSAKAARADLWGCDAFTARLSHCDSFDTQADFGPRTECI
jgi:hypothetical protein